LKTDACFKATPVKMHNSAAAINEKIKSEKKVTRAVGI